MKKLGFISACTGLVLFFLSMAPQAANAQTITGDQPRYCDEVLDRAKADLQKQADAQCGTVQTCVYCRDRRTNTDLYAMLVAQPQDSKCATVTTVSSDATGTNVVSDAAVPAKVLPYRTEIFQTTCPNSGVSLEARILESSEPVSDYKFDWQIDGKSVGKAAKLDCTCGKKAKVTVTNKKTGLSAVRTMEIKGHCSSKPTAIKAGAPASKN